MPTSQNELITLTQAARILGVTREYVRLLVHAGKLTASQVGPAVNAPYLVSKAEVVKLQKTRTKPLSK